VIHISLILEVNPRVRVTKVTLLDKEFVLAQMHLSSGDKLGEVRAREVTAVLSAVQEYAHLPLVLCGDCNEALDTQRGVLPLLLHSGVLLQEDRLKNPTCDKMRSALQ